MLIAGFFHSTGLAVNFLTHILMTFLVFTVYTSNGGELTPKRVVTTLSLLLEFKTSLTFFSKSILLMVEGKVAIIRLQVHCYAIFVLTFEWVTSHAKVLNSNTHLIVTTHMIVAPCFRFSPTLVCCWS